MASPLMNKIHADDIAKLVLRIGVGGMMLCHGVAKLKSPGGTVGGIGEMLKGKGLPEFLAYGVYLGEVVAPVLLIIGFLTRPAAAVLVFTMFTAIGLAHSGDILKLTEHGSWAIELPMLFVVGGIALVFLGAGKFSVSRGRGRWD